MSRNNKEWRKAEREEKEGQKEVARAQKQAEKRGQSMPQTSQNIPVYMQALPQNIYGNTHLQRSDLQNECLAIMIKKVCMTLNIWLK